MLPSNSDGRTYELGTKFKSTSAGQITAVRFWKAVGELGTHTGRIWSSTGTQLASVAFTGETASGWQVQNLTTPLTITANTTYVVSVNTGTNYLYVDTVSGLASAITNGNLSTIVGTNGVYGTMGTFPITAWNNSNYFRDVVFQPQVSTISLFTTQTPASTDTDGVTYELGTKWKSNIAGQITAVRFWKAVSEVGTHTGRIWSSTGTQLASVTFTGETASGWQVQNLVTPLTITANTTYVVSVNTGTNYLYANTVSGLTSAITNGNLSTIVGTNGVYGTMGTFPTTAWSSSNYFRDVVFRPGVIAMNSAGETVSLTRQLSKGSTGEDVSILQRFLSAFDHVYPEKIVSGYYGNMTASAVSAFQNMHGISPVGRVGPITLEKLNELMGM